MIKHFFKKKKASSPSDAIELDITYYKNKYPDLAGMSDKQLQRHWRMHGYTEGRAASAEHFAQIKPAQPTPTKAIETTKKEPSEHEKIALLITKSRIFDAAYYLEQYEDIKRKKADPLFHFIRHGHKENRNPNAFFDTKMYRELYLQGSSDINPLLHYISSSKTHLYKTSRLFDGKFYLEQYPDIKKSGMNPLTHYIAHGIKEGRKAVHTPQSTSAALTQGIFQSSLPDISRLRISIIVPVYGAIEETQQCINSLIRYTPLNGNIRILILDDCSPTADVKEVLQHYKNIPGIQVTHHPENLGYTRNINHGITLAERDDVILLNSDTIVSANWLRNLMLAAYSDPAVGTVTATSNNAGAFSVPVAGTNDISVELGIQGTARVVSHAWQGQYIDVPTGNGFCLYIKRTVLDDIGDFDATLYPRGYGEENDFCMRAQKHGWTNIIDPRTYVYHKRSASFKEEKEKLIIAGVQQVQQSHPEYSGAIKIFGQSELFKTVRNNIHTALQGTKANAAILKPKILFTISTRTGGTPQTNLDLMLRLSDLYDCYALACNSEYVEILRATPKGYEVIEKHQLQQKVKFATHRSYDYERLVKQLLVKYDIELLHIRHIAWHSLLLPKIAKELFIPVIKSFHDFYAVCPSVNLIDNNGQLSLQGVTDNAPNPLWKDETVLPMDAALLSFWQTRMTQALLHCDHYITTCESARDVILSNLPQLTGKSFTVIPHGRDFDTFEPPALLQQPIDKLKVLVPGNISLSKGSELIKQIKALDKNNRIEFHVLGTCIEDLKPFVIYHGSYQRSDFQRKVAEIAPHISAVFSIWPETYCHTLTESWASGIPVLGLAYGAVEERITRHGGGWLVPNDAEACFAKLLSILDTPDEELLPQLTAVRTWQAGYGAENTTAKMTGQYIAIYQALLSNTTQRALLAPRKMGFVLKGHFPDVPPTAYVRLVDWKEEFEAGSGLTVEFITWQTLLTADMYQYQEFVIQRDAIPDYAVDWCINALEHSQKNYTYDG